MALTSLLVGLKKSVIRVRNKEAVANETLKIFLFLAQMNPKWIITTTGKKRPPFPFLLFFFF